MRNAQRKTRLGTLLPLMLVLLLLLPLTAFADGEGEESGGLSDLSLYQRASEVTREFGTKLAPGSKSNLGMIEGQGSSKLTAGNAGGMLGYADILSDDKGVIGWLMSSYTNASATITYDQLQNVLPAKGYTDSDGNSTNPFYQYAGYGEALTKTGLIATVREGNFVDIGRTLASGLMIVAYLLANVAPFIFAMGLFILDALNPFKLFGTALTGLSTSKLGLIAPVAEYVSSIYETIQDLSVAVILPMMLIITVLGILVWRKSVVKTAGRYWLRVFMLFAGLPLIGATYTGTISQLNDDVKVGASYANYLVLSSYVDFEDWVKYSRLAPAGGASIQNPQTTDSEGNENMTLANRALVLAINGGPANNGTARALADQYGATSAVDGIFKEGGDRKAAEKEVSDQTAKSFRRTFGILFSHMTNARYTGSQYDGEVAGQIQKIRANNGKSTDEDIVKMFSLSASDNRTWQDKLAFGDGDEPWLKPINWDDSKGLFTHGKAGVGDDAGIFKFGEYTYNIYNGGSLEGTGVAFSTDSSYTEPTKGSKPLAPISSKASNSVGGLSPLAMYNFLNTTFSDTGLTVYSPSKSSSDLSRDAYASVSFAGSGISTMMRWAENMVVMLSLAILSIAYGIMMVMAAVRTLPRILSGVFGTALGSIAYTTKLLISVGVLLVQIIATVFMYLLSQDIVMTILLNFNQLSSKAETYFAGAATALEFVRSLMVIIVTAAVTLFLIKNMQTLREMLEEVTSSSINRLMSGLDTATGGKGLALADSTGGRVGQDGKLTGAAKEADNGIFGSLGEAAGIEAKKGRLAEERGLGKRSFGEGLKATLGTAANLQKAKAKDGMTGLLGIDGEAHKRELEAEAAATKAIGDGDLTAMGRQAEKDYNESRGEGSNEDVDVNDVGQAIDGSGDVVRGDDGTAFDATGASISAHEPLATTFGKPMTNDDGVLLDKAGNAYLDEAGNPLRMDKNGKLVDDDGNHVEVGEDGILRALPEGAKAVSAAKAAKNLDAARFNAEDFAQMRAAQGASHYGIDKDGNVLNKKGEPLETKAGAAGLDADGFLVDGNGDKLSAREFADAVDDKAFETVRDPQTGQPVLKHKGDGAMRSGALLTPDASKDPLALAKQANAAQITAQEAAAQVQNLKDSGAKGYVVQQAERYAAKTAEVATGMQEAFESSLSSDGPVASNITRDHVDGVNRMVEAKQNTFASAQQELNQMKEAGAPAEQVRRQQDRVNDARSDMISSQGQASDMSVAYATGRSPQTVGKARNKLEKAEAAFAAGAVALATAQAGGSKEAIATQQAKMQNATNLLASAQSQYRDVQQAPKGSVADIKKAEARIETLGQAVNQQDQHVNALAQSNAPRQQQVQAQAKARMLQRQFNGAKDQLTALQAPKVANTNVIPSATPASSVGQGFAALASSGISTYADYKQGVASATQSVKSSQQQLKQAKDQLAAFKNANRPPEVVQQARATVKAAQQQVSANQERLAHLQNNAHGLLKSQASFQPPIASKPLKQHGGAILGQMVQLHQAERLVESYGKKAEAGTLTTKERKAWNVLKKQSSTMKHELRNAGIKQEALASSQSLGEGIRHMNQSWNDFVSGNANPTPPRGGGSSGNRSNGNTGNRNPNPNPRPERSRNANPNPQGNRNNANPRPEREPRRPDAERSSGSRRNNANPNPQRGQGQGRNNRSNTRKPK